MGQELQRVWEQLEDFRDKRQLSRTEETCMQDRHCRLSLNWSSSAHRTIGVDDRLAYELLSEEERSWACGLKVRCPTAAIPVENPYCSCKLTIRPDSRCTTRPLLALQLQSLWRIATAAVSQCLQTGALPARPVQGDSRPADDRQRRPGAAHTTTPTHTYTNTQHTLTPRDTDSHTHHPTTTHAHLHTHPPCLPAIDR